MISRRKLKIFIAVVLLLGGGTAFYFWRQSPDQQTSRLLREMADAPRGKFSLSYGRSHEQIQADFARLGPAALPGLIEGLHDGDPTIRYLAAGQLGRLGDRRAVDPLLAALNDPDFIVQYWAVQALGDIGEVGDTRVVDALIPLLKHTDPGLRSRAAQALGMIGDRRAYEPLLALRDDPALYPRAHAVEALGRLRDERALEVLTQILSGKDASWVRSMAAKGLGYLADRRAIPALTAAAADASEQVSSAAKEALSRCQRE
jgi:HEAT repeat protein